MTDLSGKPRGDIRWGIPASILVHVVFVAALFFHLPVDQSEPQKEESVQVEIVPPPEEPEKKREEQKPQEKKAEEKKPAEEAKPEEKKPPEPAKQEEAKKAEPPPPPPEPPKQEEAKKPPTPPPPPQPPKQKEAKKAEPPPPPPPAPEEKPAEPPPAAEQAKGQPLPVLRPVFEFGEKDGGPKKSPTGNASKETTNPPAESKADADAVEPVKPAKEAATTVKAPPANPVPDDIHLPEVGIAAAKGLQNGPVAGTSPDAAKTEIVTAPPAASSKSDPSKPPTAGKPVELTEAKTLFSQSETDDPIATTAMGSIPRGVRAGQLCATELSFQLWHASPPYPADLVRPYRLPSGSVLEVKRSEFRANAQWYDLSFRCELNEGATKVISFAFEIGKPVPRSEWRKRGFPE